jgi:competence protein ComEC
LKKIISLLLVFTFFLSSNPMTSNAESPFKDVGNTHPFLEEITYLTTKDIISGFTPDTFKPNNTVTRAQAAIMIGRALGLDGTQRGTTFTDVGASIAASGYIDSAVRRGIITGYGNNTFRPNEAVTRGQMAIFLSRAFSLKQEADVSFTDVPAGSAAYVHVKRILNERITIGYPNGTYKPNNKLTRSDFSAFMARALDERFKVNAPIKAGTGKNLVAHFIDVGQGDSILIVTPNKKTILIDGGKDAAGEKVVAYLRKVGVSAIDLLVATHPDADHIGGLEDVINNFTIRKVLDSGKAHTSQTYIDYLALIDAKNIPFEIVHEGRVIGLDDDIQILALNSSTANEDINGSSVVLKINYGQIDFLLTGDAEAEQERAMVETYNVEAEILKVGHHGSNTSSSQVFLNEVKPKVSILSYGEGNYYGHPVPEIVQRLRNIGSNIYSTAISGDITVTTNGQTYSVSAKPWQTGTGTTPAPVPTPTPAPAPNPSPAPAPSPSTSGSVDMVFVNRETEIVALKNVGKTDVNMTGWKIVSVEGPQTYNFPEGYVLKAGATVYVKSGKNAVHNPPSSLLWSKGYMWNNDYDPARLYNARGALVETIQ